METYFWTVVYAEEQTPLLHMYYSSNTPIPIFLISPNLLTLINTQSQIMKNVGHHSLWTIGTLLMKVNFGSSAP
jgi:hypothetical protein